MTTTPPRNDPAPISQPGKRQSFFTPAMQDYCVALFAPEDEHLAGTGAIRGGAAALVVADRLFAWPIAPWCPEIF